MQPAWERQPEAQPGFVRETPAQALANPATVPFQRRRSSQEIEQERQLQQLAANNSLGGMTGIANGQQQAEEFGRGALELTGAPAWARGIQDLQYGRPGEAIPEFLWGAVNTAGIATLPFGAGGRPPPRMGMAPRALPQMSEAMPPLRPPARLPGRASDGSVLPVRPSEPFRNSMRGGSDDLMDAARSSPDAGGARAGRLPDGALREIDDSGARVNFPAWPAPSRTYRLEELLEHEELYADFPELRNFPVVVGDVRLHGGKFGNAGVAQADRILIDPSGTREFTGRRELPSLRALLAHEIQHVVDRIEGRGAQGGSPDWLRQNVILPEGVSPQQAYERLRTEQTAHATERRIGMTAEQRAAIEPFSEAPLEYRRVPLLRSFMNAMRRGEQRQLEAYEAARPSLVRAQPDGGSAQAGFDTSRVVYRGLGRQYDPANGGYYQSFTSSLDDAREYGSNVIAAHIRPGRNLAIDGGGNNFNALSVEQLPADVRTRLHPSVGASATTDQIAHAAREAGYDSVTVRNVHDNRWGERPGRNTPTRTIDFVFDTRNISPLDNVPSQPSAAASTERVALSEADRALLAELNDFPGGTLPPLRPHEGSWIATSPDGRVLEFFEQADAQRALEAGWTVRTAGDHLANLNRAQPNAGPTRPKPMFPGREKR